MRTSFILPQLILPSGQAPNKHAGPQFLNKCGATSRHCLSICSATSLISHCARLQQRCAKKFSRLLALKVQTIFVVDALGRINLASSFAFFYKSIEFCFVFVSVVFYDFFIGIFTVSCCLSDISCNKCVTNLAVSL